MSSEVKEVRNVHRVPIEEIIADEELNGRVKKVSQKDIEETAHSILEYGQLQPGRARKIKKGDNKGKYQLSFGFTRYKALKWGNETGLFNPPLPMIVTVVDANDEESFIQNVVENRHRNATTPIDDAHNMRRLREQYGKSNTEIAKLYQVSQAYVSQLTKLLTLDSKTQAKVAEEKLTLNGALLLADSDIPASEIPDLLKSCSDDDGKINTGILKSTLRNFANDKDETKTTTETTEEGKDDVSGQDNPEDMEDILGDKKGPKKNPKKSPKEKEPKEEKEKPKYARSLKEIKEYWREQTGITDPLCVGEFAKTMVKFLEGTCSDNVMTKAFDKLTEALQNGGE
jgi:ParB/RepB/Spo0J family partition protein